MKSLLASFLLLAVLAAPLSVSAAKETLAPITIAKCVDGKYVIIKRSDIYGFAQKWLCAYYGAKTDLELFKLKPQFVR